MRDRSKLFSHAATVLLVLTGLLVGCGGDDGEPTPSSEQSPAGSTEGATTAAPSGASRAERERVVAEVNGQPVHAWQLEEVVTIVKAQLQAQGLPITPQIEPELRKGAMQLVVANEVVYQQAKAEGMAVDPRQIDQRLQELIAQFGSEDEFGKYLRDAELTEEDVREEAEYSMLVQQWVQSVTGQVAVDESEARALYEQWKPYLKEPAQARAAFILVKSSPDDPPAMREDARRRIDEAHEKILNGVDFAQVAREYSQAPSAAQGGDVGFFPRGVMAPQFEEQAFTLPIGAVSEVFETGFGLNILKVLDRKEDRPLSFEEVKPNLMLSAAQQEESEVLEQRVQALVDSADIQVFEKSEQPQDETRQG